MADQAEDTDTGGVSSSASCAAEKLTPGTKVYVDCERYTGEGCVTDQTYYGSHFMHLGEDHAGDDRGFHVAVRLPNDNTHLYPLDDVRMAK